MSHTILLYYKYVPIENPTDLMDGHRQLCKSLNLTGRIIIAKEGINGTVEGLTDDTEKYIEAMRTDERFFDVVFKKSEGIGDAFPKLSIKVRDEIVSSHLGEKDIDPNVVTGKRLNPTELDKWYENEEDFVVVDMRNDYEFNVGHFENSVMPGMLTFSDLKEIIPKIEQFRDRKLITVCTGGVRCEKASGYLVQNGFNDVYQLDGGMATYLERHPGRHFKGKMYVFDKRITMQTEKQETIGKCVRCESLSDDFINCTNLKCNDHVICCFNCRDEKGNGYCGEDCDGK